MERELHQPSRIERAQRFIQRLVMFFPLEAPAHMSNHYEHPLDEPIEPVTGWPTAERWDHPALKGTRGWTEMGEYIDRTTGEIRE